MKGRMHKILRNAGQPVLFVVLAGLVTGVWTCLWLPPL